MALGENHILVLFVGLVFAGVGGELFVKGAVGTAIWARISKAIVGVTIAAFATSSPELSVAISSAVAGTPEISLGDALGSNVVNVALILGLALSIKPLYVAGRGPRLDIGLAVMAPLLSALLMLDGSLSRIDGVIFLVLFIAWLALVVRDALDQRKNSHTSEEKIKGLWIFFSISIGLGLLIMAGKLIVIGASGIGESLGLSPFVIGATMVAIGTSVPELATTLIARFRGHEEIGLGNILGSNIFNNLFIVAVAAMICPISVSSSSTLATLAFTCLGVLFLIPNRNGMLSRARGLGLLGIYFVYMVSVLYLGGSGH